MFQLASASEFRDQAITARAITGQPITVRRHATVTQIHTAVPVIMVPDMWAATGVAMEDAVAEDMVAAIAAKAA